MNYLNIYKIKRAVHIFKLYEHPEIQRERVTEAHRAFYIFTSFSNILIQSMMVFVGAVLQ